MKAIQMSARGRSEDLDVCAINVQEMVNLLAPFAAESGQDVAALTRRLWGRVDDPGTWSPERLTTGWLPHRVYALVEQGFFDALGNPAVAADWVRRVVALDADVGDMGSELVKALGRRWAITPRAVAGVLPAEGRKRNTLKQIVILHAEAGRLLTRTLYRGRDGTPYTVRPEDDIGSNAFFAAARVAAPAAVLTEPAVVHHEVLEVSLDAFVAYCQQWSVPVDFRVISDSAFLDGRRLARAVSLGPDATGCHTVQLATPGAIGVGAPAAIGMRLERDLCFTDPNGREWVAAKAGTVFSADAGCSVTRFEYRAVDSWLDRALIWFGRTLRYAPWLRRQFTVRVADRTQLIADQASAGLVESGLLRELAVANSVAAIYPDRASYDAALRGEHLQHDEEAVCFCCDVSGFGRYTERHAPDQVVAVVNALLSASVEVLNHHGFDLVSFTGDGGLFSASAALGRSRGRPLAQRVLAGVRAARQLTRVSDESLGVTTRVGVCVGPVTYFALKSSAAHPALLPQAVGLGLNRVTRVESALKPLQVEVGRSVAGIAASALDALGPDADLGALGLRAIPGRVRVKETSIDIVQILPRDPSDAAEDCLEEQVTQALVAVVGGGTGDPVDGEKPASG